MRGSRRGVRYPREGLCLLLVAVMLLAGACTGNEPDWEGIALANATEAKANQAEARIYTEQARAAQAKAEAALAQAQASNAAADAEYAHTLRDAIGGLVRVTNQAQALLSMQIMLPYLIIAGLVVVLGIFGLLGVFLLRYLAAQANAQRILIEAYTYRLADGNSPLLIRPGVRAMKGASREE